MSKPNWHGAYTFKVNNTTNGEDKVTVEFDNKEPTAASESPYTPANEGYATSQSPEIKVKVDANGPASLKNISLEVSGPDNTYTHTCTDLGDDNPRTCSFTPDENLQEGETYDVSWDAYDAVGNPGGSSWNFTVDTEYNGGDDPSVSWPDGVEVSDGVVRLDDGSVDLTVGVESENVDSVGENAQTLTCYDGGVDDGTEIGSDGFKKSDDGDTLMFSCSLDTDEDYLSDGEVELSLELCDAAGNCKPFSKQDYSFDLEKPSLEVSSSRGSSFNSDFKLDYSVSDDTGVEKLEYFFDSDTNEGEGIEVSDVSGDGSFTVDVPDDLGQGDQTVYVRAKDSAGRWSEVKSFDFSYFPDATPSVSLSVPDTFSLKAGTQKSFEATVKNTGKIFISSLNVYTDHRISSVNKTVYSLKPGDSVSKTIELNPSAEVIGKHSLKVKTSNVERSETVQVTVEANQAQVEKIKDDYESSMNRFESLAENVSELKKKVSGDLEQRLMNNFSELNQSVSEAKSAYEDGMYFKVDDQLSDFDSQFSRAQQTFKQVKSDHESAQTWKLIFIVLALIVLALVGAAAFLLYSDEYDVDVDNLVDSDINVDGLDDLKARAEAAFTSKEEADEFEWDGFKDD